MFEMTSRARRIDAVDTGPAHWLRTAMGSTPAQGSYLCALVRLTQSADASTIAALAALPYLKVPPHEERRLYRLKNQGQLARASVLAYIAAGEVTQVADALASGGLGDLITVLPGSGAAETQGDGRARAHSFAWPDTPELERLAARAVFKRAPVLGIIDDEIGYLNARFCTRGEDGSLRSRVQGVWVQHAPRAGAVSLTDGPIVNAAQIQSMLQDVSSGALVEDQAYARFLPKQSVGRFAPVTHGTHVLDLAAGFAPDAALDIPIFAVDMPAQALNAPGARRGTSYLIQGLRWLVHAALDHIDAQNAASLAADDGQGALTLLVPDIVLSCSIGSYAGPKDGTGLFAQLIGEELDLVNAMRTPPALGPGYHARATLFQSFGNAYTSNQSARHLGVQRAGPLDWHLPRNDRDASLLELRVSGAKLSTLWLRIGGQDFEIKAPGKHRYRQIEMQGQPIVRLYREGDETGGRQLFSLLVRPTHALGLDGFVTAPAGSIRLVADTDEPADITWQVERDDVPFGYGGEGKQSWLADPMSQGWNAGARDYSAPVQGSAILREGSETAEAHSPHPAIVTVGSAIADDPAYAPVPSSYSAAGSLDPAISARRGPDVSATGDDGSALGGVLATGTTSGSVARLAGTSVAAPQAARRMLLTGLGPEHGAPLSTRTGPRYEDRSGARAARISG